MTRDARDLRRASGGDREALRRVVERWWPRIRRWALVFCGHPAVAEDAVQESLVRLLRFIGRYDPRRPFAPWLKALVRNACHDELTRRGTAGTLDLSEIELAAAPARIDRTLDMAEAARRAKAAFADLSPRQREVLDLVDLQGHTPTETAEQLGLTAGAVRAQLFEARRRVRARLLRGADVLPLLREA